MDLDQAIAIAAQAHAGQRDRAGQPYILHPLRVMLTAKGTDAKVVAVLHDVVEDSDWSLDRLREAGLTEDQAAALDSVTKRRNEDYFDFVARAGRSVLGRLVKILDLQDNADESRIAFPNDEDRARFIKYRKALSLLQAEPGSGAHKAARQLRAESPVEEPSLPEDDA